MEEENGTEPRLALNDSTLGEPAKRRTRAARPFPAASFEEALNFARDLFTIGSGRPVRRLTLFDHLGKAPESGPSRALITNANRYGLIKGGYSAEQLELTPDGLKAVDENVPRREQARTRVKLAIEDIEAFRLLYERFRNSRLPARAVLVDAAREFSIPEEFVEECVDTFIVNLRFVGLLQTLSGADRIVTIDHLLDSVPATASAATAPAFIPRLAIPDASASHELVTQEHADSDYVLLHHPDRG